MLPVVKLFWKSFKIWRSYTDDDLGSPGFFGTRGVYNDGGDKEQN